MKKNKIYNIMRHLLICLGVLASLLFLSSCGDGKTYAEIETDYGTMKVVLFDETPKHRDNFIKLAKEGFYDDLLFHRVIKDFMVQGGDPDSKGAAPGTSLGMGGPGYRIDAEVGLPHLRGTLAAARDGNPDKKSSGSQFYLVQGKPATESQVNHFETQKNIKYTPEQRRLYMEVGGAPYLDMDYTVFGEIVEGLEVLEKISLVPTDPNNRPKQDVKMKVRIL